MSIRRFYSMHSSLGCVISDPSNRELNLKVVSGEKKQKQYGIFI